MRSAAAPERRPNLRPGDTYLYDRALGLGCRTVRRIPGSSSVTRSGSGPALPASRLRRVVLQGNRARADEVRHMMIAFIANGFKIDLDRRT